VVLAALSRCALYLFGTASAKKNNALSKKDAAPIRLKNKGRCK